MVKNQIKSPVLPVG